MPNQYVASDSRTGLEVAVTGAFPEDPEDRVRIARTCTLFTRLMATTLAQEDVAARRQSFRAVETQLEVAEALLRGDLEEVQRLVRDTLTSMGVSEEQLAQLQEELRKHLGDFEGLEGLGGLGLGGPDTGPGS